MVQSLQNVIEYHNGLKPKSFSLDFLDTLFKLIIKIIGANFVNDERNLFIYVYALYYKSLLIL